MTGFVDQFLHVRRQVAAEAHLVPCYGMYEPEGRRMERLAPEIQPREDFSQPRIGSPVKRIPQ